MRAPCEGGLPVFTSSIAVHQPDLSVRENVRVLCPGPCPAVRFSPGGLVQSQRTAHGMASSAPGLSQLFQSERAAPPVLPPSCPRYSARIRTSARFRGVPLRPQQRPVHRVHSHRRCATRLLARDCPSPPGASSYTAAASTSSLPVLQRCPNAAVPSAPRPGTSHSDAVHVTASAHGTSANAPGHVHDHVAGPRLGHQRLQHDHPDP